VPKRFRVATLTALALLLPLSTPAIQPTHAGTKISFSQKTRPIRIEPPRDTVLMDEELRYAVRWYGIPVGIGRIKIERAPNEDGEATYRMEAVAGANDFLNGFYPLRDELSGLAAASDLRSITSTKKLQEGKYRADERVDFDYKTGLAHYESLKNGEKKDIPISGVVHDVLSAFYWFRLQPLAIGKRVKTRVFADEKEWEFEVKILRSERLEIRGLGTFDTVIAQPIAKFKGVLVERGKVWIHYTADSRRIPLRIKIETKYGPVIGVLEALPSNEQ